MNVNCCLYITDLYTTQWPPCQTTDSGYLSGIISILVRFGRGGGRGG